MKKIVILIVGLISCHKIDKESRVYVQPFVIVDKWRDFPRSVHEEISPRYKAVLNNGDTIICNKFSQIGDTVYYKNLDL